MADETNPTSPVETASVDGSPKTKEKKNRAPRKPKAAPEAMVNNSVSAPVKMTRRSANRTLASDASTTSVLAAPVVKSTSNVKQPVVSKARTSSSSLQAAGTSPELDGFADLLKLEEENQKLRKALSEKLRAENTELRKKLGLA